MQWESHCGLRVGQGVTKSILRNDITHTKQGVGGGQHLLFPCPFELPCLCATKTIGDAWWLSFSFVMLLVTQVQYSWHLETNNLTGSKRQGGFALYNHKEIREMVLFLVFRNKRKMVLFLVTLREIR